MRLWVRARIGAMVGTSGAAVMAAIGIAEGGGGRLLWPDLPFIACAFAGATAAGLVLAPFFGRGALRAVLGAVVATLAGAGLGGAAALGLEDPFAGLFLGPMFVVAWILSSPSVAAAWIATMALAHLGAESMAPGDAGSPRG
jgi:hypothetical protein